jgi:uncharacterized protein
VTSRPFRVGRSNTGLGLFATQRIEKGAFIVAYRGRRITTAEADRLEERGSRYIFEINSRWSIDGSSRRNIARYVNHACRPNAEAIDHKRGIGYRALRAIKPGDQITLDYGREYFKLFLENGGCRCGTCIRRKDAARKKHPGKTGAKRAPNEK